MYQKCTPFKLWAVNMSDRLFTDANNRLHTLTEDEVARYLHMSAHSNDIKLLTISVWAESNKDNSKISDSIMSVFTRIVRHLDATNLSHAAISRFLLEDHISALNRDCRYKFRSVNLNKVTKYILFDWNYCSNKEYAENRGWKVFWISPLAKFLFNIQFLSKPLA